MDARFRLSFISAVKATLATLRSLRQQPEEGNGRIPAYHELAEELTGKLSNSFE